MNRKIIIIFLCFAILVVIILLLYRKNLLRIFEKSESLNYYKDVNYVEIFDERGLINGSYNIVIDNSEDIEKLFEFLNSLELVKEELPRRYRYRKYRNEDGYFHILIVLKNDVDDFNEVLLFMGNYLIFLDEGHKSESIEYYIKDSGYSSKDKKSKVYNFLYDMINKK